MFGRQGTVGTTVTSPFSQQAMFDKPPLYCVYQMSVIQIIIKQVASNKLSLLPKIDLQNTQTLLLNLNGNYLQKYLRDQDKRFELDRQSV
jgi:hypothetical protein